MSDILVVLGRVGINGMPPEILSEIFVRCLDFASGDLIQPLLSGVCREWHTVVLATPALWASLDILCDVDVLRPPLPVIRTHLQRSGTHPLSFNLHVYDKKYFDRDSPHLLSVLTTLATACQRWYDVEIRLRTMTQDILDLIAQGDAPLLRSVKCHMLTTKKEVPTPLSMAHDHPHLESFQWNGSGSLLLLPLGNTQLTSLSLETKLSVSKCITILRLSPRLSSAEFRNLQSTDPSPAPHLIHPVLRTLTVKGQRSEVLLGALTLPALLDLDLTTGEMQTYSMCGIPLAAFLERSNPPLRKLSLSMNQIPRDAAFVRILAAAHHLRVLKMAGCTLSDTLTAGLIRALHPQPPPGTSLCPHLRRLDLSKVSNCPDGLCGAMLRARWGAAARVNGVAWLERADIEIEDDDDHDRDLADSEELRAGGMQGMISWSERWRPWMLRRVQIHDC